MSHTTFVDDETFAKRLNVKHKVLTYIHPDDRSQANEKEEEAYWVASIARKKPWQIVNDGTFGGGEFKNLFKKGEWVTWIEWMTLLKCDGHGNRLYRRQAGQEQVISVRSFLRTGVSNFRMPWNRHAQAYVISSDAHAKIMKYTKGLDEI